MIRHRHNTPTGRSTCRIGAALLSSRRFLFSSSFKTHTVFQCLVDLDEWGKEIVKSHWPLISIESQNFIFSLFLFLLFSGLK